MENRSFTNSPTKSQKRTLIKMTSAEYEASGLTGNSVEGLQVNALKMELQREKNTVESLHQDIEMLRAQLT